MELSCINRSKLPLLEHQKKIVNWLENNRGIILNHSVGSGKTLLAVTASQCFLDKYSNSKVIVIAPKSLISNFKKEILAYGSKIDPSKYVFYSFEKFKVVLNGIFINTFFFCEFFELCFKIFL